MKHPRLELYESEKGCMIRPFFPNEPAGQWDTLLALGKELTRLSEQMEGRWLLLSDFSVYGKLYGSAHPIAEDEMGYVSHTDPADSGAFIRRMAENLFCRMIRDGKLSGCIARIEAGCACEGLTRAELTQLEQLLEKGADGEAYNLDLVPGREKKTLPDSPLSPLPFNPDTRKKGILE